jgi:hypothetical protein
MASAVQGEDVLFTRLQSDMTQDILIEDLHAAAGSKMLTPPMVRSTGPPDRD